MALYVAVRSGDASLFERIQHIYLTTADPNLKALALSVLSDFSSPELMARALDFDTSDQVRSQDAVFAMTRPLYRNLTRDVAWSYVKTNWERVHNQLTESNGAALVRAAGSFCSAAARKDVEEFFGTHKVAASSTALKHSLERIDDCIEFRSLQEPQLKTWLDSQPAL
jgi:aminopeptidase N/puromycin-sensitive aminopeptidase